MKKLLFLLAIAGLLFACDKDDDNEELTSLEVLQQAIAATDQEAATKLFEGVWVDEENHERITITTDQCIRESNIYWTPDTSINIKPLWIKTNNIYQLIDLRDTAKYEAHAFSFEKPNNDHLFYKGWVYMYLGPYPTTDIKDLLGYIQFGVSDKYIKIK